MTPDPNDTHEPRILYRIVYSENGLSWREVSADEMLATPNRRLYVHDDMEGFRPATLRERNARLSWPSPDAGDAR